MNESQYNCIKQQLKRKWVVVVSDSERFDLQLTDEEVQQMLDSMRRDELKIRKEFESKSDLELLEVIRAQFTWAEYGSFSLEDAEKFSVAWDLLSERGYPEETFQKIHDEVKELKLFSKEDI